MGAILSLISIDAMKDLTDLANAIGVSPKWIRSILYGKRLRENYREVEIPKRASGTRMISIPPSGLLELQKKVNVLLTAFYSPKSCVHGFAKERSVVTNAQNHVAMRHVVNFDLKDFFTSIHFGRVQGLFKRPPFSFPDELATIIAQISCKEEEEGGVLPQGGALSPLVSNLVCRGLDNDLMRFAKQHKLRFSRYADDLTFSSRRTTLPSELIDLNATPQKPGTEIERLVTQHGFLLNLKKITHRTQKRRQEVTGLTVNRFPNIPRKFFRRLQSMMRAWREFGIEKAQQSYSEQHRSPNEGLNLENVVRGRIGYIRMVRGDSDYLYRRFAREFNRLSSNQLSITKLSVVNSSKLRSSQLSFPGWNSLINRYAKSVYLVEVVLKNERIGCGSAFHIGNGYLATAGHNLVDFHGDQHCKVSFYDGDSKVVVNKMFTAFKGTSSCHDIGIIHAESLKDVNSRIPTQLRFPEIGEEVIALGFPTVPQRDATLVAHIGTIEALPLAYSSGHRFIQVSFQMGGGLRVYPKRFSSMVHAATRYLNGGWC